MALNTSKCNRLMPLRFKGLNHNVITLALLRAGRLCAVQLPEDRSYAILAPSQV